MLGMGWGTQRRPENVIPPALHISLTRPQRAKVLVMELAGKKGKDDLDWRGERDWDSQLVQPPKYRAGCFVSL